MMPHNYTPLHLPHHLEPVHKKGISPLWFLVILVLVLLQGVFVYMFFSGKIGGSSVQNTVQPSIATPTGTALTPEEAMISSESATPSSPSEVETQINELEQELEAAPEVTPAPDIPSDL